MHAEKRLLDEATVATINATVATTVVTIITSGVLNKPFAIIFLQILSYSTQVLNYYHKVTIMQNTSFQETLAGRQCNLSNWLEMIS